MIVQHKPEKNKDATYQQSTRVKLYYLV